MKSLFEFDSSPGFVIPDSQIEGKELDKKYCSDAKPGLPSISEIDLVRHYTRLSQQNVCVDSNFYPLGSCTMKYNPKINEDVAALPGFTNIHPFQDKNQLQGILEVLYNFEKYLCAIFGYDAFTLSPAAGAHGEATAILLMKAYHKSRRHQNRNVVIVPDSSHGTNPASAAFCGWSVVQIKSNDRGEVDLSELKKTVGDNTAALMLTNPNTLGVFDSKIREVANIVHDAGGLLYYDGANANANLSKTRPADLGFDIAHFNLHKTFSTPHGGGGPGSGPVGVSEKLIPFLPNPRIIKRNTKFIIKNLKNKSIGNVHSFYGNINVIIKAYTYILSLGHKGLKEVSENAVLNANYMMKRLKDYYYLPYDRCCQHEFVLSAKWQKEKFGIKALDIAKRLIDYGFHPPTIYFPLIVSEALMIEPTETESLQTLDEFCDVMITIAKECETKPELLKEAPHYTPVGRLDEVKAVKELNVRWTGK